jgi:hypothetical protein
MVRRHDPNGIRLEFACQPEDGGTPVVVPCITQTKAEARAELETLPGVTPEWIGSSFPSIKSDPSDRMLPRKRIRTPPDVRSCRSRSSELEAVFGHVKALPQERRQTFAELVTANDRCSGLQTEPTVVGARVCIPFLPPPKRRTRQPDLALCPDTYFSVLFLS